MSAPAGLGDPPGGDPAGLQALAAKLFALARALSEVSVSVAQETVGITGSGTWSGLSATIYRAEGQITSAGIRAASDAYTDAAGVLQRLASEISAAQQEAASAEGLFAQEQATARSDPLRAMDPTWYFPARAAHDAARARAESAALDAAGQLSAIAARAKPKPKHHGKPHKHHWWNSRPVKDLEGFGLNVLKNPNYVNEQLAIGAVHTAEGMGKGIWHTGKHWREIPGNMDNAFHFAREHPLEFAKAIVNVKELKKHPLQWAGGLAFNVGLLFVTDGIGTAAEVGLTAEGAEVAAETAANTSRVARAGEAARAAGNATRGERAAARLATAGRISAEAYVFINKIFDPVEWIKFLLKPFRPLLRRAGPTASVVRTRVAELLAKERLEPGYEGPTWDPAGKPYALGDRPTANAAAGAAEVRGAFRPGVQLADDANSLLLRQGRAAIFKANTMVTDRIAHEPETLLRVFAKGREAEHDAIFVKPDDIVGLTREQIRRKFGLDFTPDTVAVARAQTGAEIREGEAATSGTGGIRVQVVGGKLVWGHVEELPKAINAGTVVDLLTSDGRAIPELNQLGEDQQDRNR